MKPKTWTQIKARLLENVENSWTCEDDDEAHDMGIEIETMEWISMAEGKGKEFTKYHQACQISVEDRDQNG